MHHSIGKIARRTTFATLAACAVLAAGAASAFALGLNVSLLGLTISLDTDFEPAPNRKPPPEPTTASSCSSPTFVQPFDDWDDERDYVLAPGGAFEQTTPAGWSLGKARVGLGNEPWYVRSRSDGRALRLGGGTSVTSAPMCVDLNYPTFRVFVDGEADLLSNGDDRLRIDVIYRDTAGSPSQTVGWLDNDRKWALSPDVPVVPELGGAEPGMRKVAFRFTPEGRGSDFRIDDLYVDPRRRR